MSYDKYNGADKVFADWGNSDFNTYVENKSKAEEIYKNTGKWDTGLLAQNEELRKKYNLKEDKFSYNDLGLYKFDKVIWGSFIDYGKKSEKEGFREKAIELETKYNNYQEQNSGSYSGSGSYTGGSSYSGGFGNIGSDTMSAIMGIGILYIFLSLFRK